MVLIVIAALIYLNNINNLININNSIFAMKNNQHKQHLCNRLSYMLLDNQSIMSHKLIPFELLFQWYCNSDANYALSSTQFARLLTLLIQEKKEYYKETLRDKKKKRIYYFLFLPTTQNNSLQCFHYPRISEKDISSINLQQTT